MVSERKEFGWVHYAMMGVAAVGLLLIGIGVFCHGTLCVFVMMCFFRRDYNRVKLERYRKWLTLEL